MKIAVLHYHRIGGSGIIAYEIGRVMAEERGHEVHFIGLEPPFRFGDNYCGRMKFHKVWIKEYPVFDFQPYSLALASQLAEIIVKNNIDVVHSHYALPHAVSAILARQISGADVRLVTTLHGTDITIVGSHPTMRGVTRFAIEKSDAVTAVSNHLAQQTEEKIGVPAEKIHTIYNFVNPKNFNPDLKIPDLCSQTDNKFIAIHTSNLREVKAPLDVIRIFKGIQDRLDRPAELWIVGEGPLQQDMENLADELGIREKINFMGIQTSVGSIISCADLMILPSSQESFGLVALEAMACGVPVIASRAGGLPEVIEDSVNGMLFEFGKTSEAADKIIKYWQDGESFDRFRQEGIRTATDKFDMKSIISGYEEIYRG